MQAVHAILIGAVLATIGWIHGSRRTRLLSRKQHTINVILQANFNGDFLRDRAAVAAMIRAGGCSDGVLDGSDEELLASLRKVLNHYEFVSAAVRNGDLDEKLLRDSERAAYVQLFGECEKYVWKVRDTRDRQTLYEHLEWLHNRWSGQRPGLIQRACEVVMAKPFYGKKSKKN